MSTLLVAANSNGVSMKVREFRELTADMRRMVNDWYACVNDTERQSWQERAHRLLAAFVCASCPRATPKDLEDQLQAYREYIAITVRRQEMVRCANHAVMTRSARYNKSAGRAVRLARAARGAMRRGYF